MKIKHLAFLWAYLLPINGRKTESRGAKPMSFIEKDIVLTTEEAIKYLKISRPTYLKYIHLGKIKAIKAGNGWRVHQSELYRFLKVGESD